MYTDDSFFTLSALAGAGLALISLTMAVLMLGFARCLMRDREWVWRVMLVLALFIAFVWLSPQVYYTYYRILIEGLPAQWVISMPRLADIFGLMTFTGRATLSAHGQGLLFWALVILALGRRGPHR